MKKEVIVIALAFLLILPVVSASLSSNMEEVEKYVGEYKAGSLTAPQLVVNIEYVKNKMYEELDKERRNAFTEAEIVAVFDTLEGTSTLVSTSKTEIGGDGRKDGRFTQYEKRFETNDFHVVFRADSFRLRIK